MPRIKGRHIFPWNERQNLQLFANGFRKKLLYRFCTGGATGNGKADSWNAFSELLEAVAEIENALVVQPATHEEKSRRVTMGVVPVNKVIAFHSVRNVPNPSNIAIVFQLEHRPG